MKTPSPYRHKDRRSLHSRTQIVREISSHWHREVPADAARSIPWTVLASLIDSLSDRLDTDLLVALRDCVERRSVSGYLALGAEFGSVQSHSSHASYFASISVLNLFKKFPWTDGDMDPQRKALDRFYEAERLCRSTNRRIARHRKSDFALGSLPRKLSVHQVFHLARRKIQSWLGECNIAKLTTKVKHGPGGCVGLNRPYTTPYYKFADGDYTVAKGAYYHALRLILNNQAWARALWEDAFGSNADNVFDTIWRGKTVKDDSFVGPLTQMDAFINAIHKQRLFEETLAAIDARMEVIDYNKVTFVPKDATTLRAIAIEGRLMVLLQLAVGTFLKECLKRAGCDLTDQTRNQDLAKIGSTSQDCYDPVTIDLRMASDCLAIELVRELLPPEWFDYLCDLRSSFGMLNGERIKWEKFSSMGNGYTFELESMIFYALAQSVSDLTGTTGWFSDTFGPAYKYAYVSVFGDDIIAPSIMSDHLIDILRFCGFQTNRDKTFTSGPFRESCGKDYFDGVLVRPFYMKRSISQSKDLIHLHNNLRGLWRDGLYEIEPTVRLVRSLLPKSLSRELVGPLETSGDEYIWACPDECHASSLVVWDTDWQNWAFPVMRAKPVLAEGRHRLRYKYLQFLYANAGGSSVNAFTKCAFEEHVSSGGSAGEVVLSGSNGPGVITWASLV